MTKSSRNQVWLFSLAVVIAAVLLTVAQTRRGSAEPARPLADRSLAELTLEDQGATFVLIEGTLYRVDERRGELVYVDLLYDKDFFAKNYAVKDGR